MQRPEFRRDDVFGLNRDRPLNYVTREAVDTKLIAELTREKHVVVYGSSKQGKTCLRKVCLKDEDYVVVQCLNRWNLRELHSAILKEAGFRITQSVEKTVTGTNKINAKVEGGLLGVKVGGGVEDETTEGTTTKEEELELDAEDPNDVIRALGTIDFKRFIILEDFHYLQQQTQKDFAVALKAFHEASSLCFIIVGVWLEENRLIVYNGDLTGRVVAVNADLWTPDDLRKVVDAGEELLNVQFADAFTGSLIDNAENNVYIVQEACRLACERAGVNKTLERHAVIGEQVDVRALTREVVDQQSGRYMAFITQFAVGFQDTELEMYKWLLYPILTASVGELRNGLSYRQILKGIQTRHPKGQELNPGNLTQALLNTAPLQVKKNITPIILDYDTTNRRLNIVDRGFLIWKAHQNDGDLLEAAGLPFEEGPQLEFPHEEDDGVEAN